MQHALLACGGELLAENALCGAEDALVLFTHSNLIRYLLAHFLKFSKDELWERLEIHEASISLIEITNNESSVKLIDSIEHLDRYESFLLSGIPLAHMIKAIFFDQGGVLVSEEGVEQIELLSKASGYSFEHCKMIRKKYWNKLKLGYITDEEYWQGTDKYDDLNKGILKELTIDKSEYLPLRHNSIEAIELFDFSKALLNQLSKKYILGILSNNSKEWGENVLKASGLDQYFKIRIYSHVVGLAKPDKKIYALAFSKLTHVSPEEILLIDDKEKNLIPARELGWSTILFTSYDALVKDLGALSIEIT